MQTSRIGLDPSADPTSTAGSYAVSLGICVRNGQIAIATRETSDSLALDGDLDGDLARRDRRTALDLRLGRRLFASAWGPGNSDEIVSGGVAQVPWFGLPVVGAFAAMAGLVYLRNPPRAWTACVVAAACLAAWTVFLFAAND